MALVTSQQLTNYYERYADIDVTFNKQVTRAIRLMPRKTFLRLLGYQVPCIIYSSSMKGAKVIASVNAELFEKIREANNLISLRFCFENVDKQDPLSFFVSARATGFNPYDKEHADLNFINLKYTQRPSDDLIAILGQLLEASINSKQRKEERIEIETETIRKLGLSSREATVHIDNVPRKCLLKDISFSGAKILIASTSETLDGKTVVFKLHFNEGKQTHSIPGKIIRFEEFQEQKGIGSAGIQFDEQSVPMEYKMRLNEYLVTVRKSSS